MSLFNRKVRSDGGEPSASRYEPDAEYEISRNVGKCARPAYRQMNKTRRRCRRSETRGNWLCSAVIYNLENHQKKIRAIKRVARLSGLEAT